MLTAVLIGIYALITTGLFVHASLTLAWMLHTWRSPHASTRAGFRFRRSRPRHTFSLLVPARHEETVLDETLERLAERQHPDFEILAIVGHDDPGTHQVAEAAASRYPDRIRVVVDYSWPKNKPKALNTALPEARGEIVGMFDAEDECTPGYYGQSTTSFSRPRPTWSRAECSS